MNWKELFKDPLLLQQETEGIGSVSTGLATVKPQDAEWDAITQTFVQENARARMLQPALPTDLPYRFIARADRRRGLE